jgi:hypothetical protein
MAAHARERVVQMNMPGQMPSLGNFRTIKPLTIEHPGLASTSSVASKIVRDEKQTQEKFDSSSVNIAGRTHVYSSIPLSHACAGG